MFLCLFGLTGVITVVGYLPDRSAASLIGLKLVRRCKICKNRVFRRNGENMAFWLEILDDISMKSSAGPGYERVTWRYGRVR